MATRITRGQEATPDINLTKPVFVKARDLPEEEDNRYTVSEICRACEDVAGYKSMDGAQRIGGLWRLYPANREARVQLLLEGISLRRVHVTLLDTNPFLIMGNNGQEIPTTRVTVSDIHGWPSTQPGTCTQPCPIVHTAVHPLFTQPCPGRTMSTAVCIYVAGLCASCPAV